MAGFLELWKGDPDFVNEKGVKWWIDDSTTQYLQKEDRNGIKLDMVCYAIEETDGKRSRLVINRARDIVEQEQSLEQLAIKIDMRKFLIFDRSQNPEPALIKKGKRRGK